MEFKYKVWDKEQKKMLVISFENEEDRYNKGKAILNYSTQNGIYATLSGYRDEDGNPYEIDADILPYTGVKDLNEKEIYLGHILRNRTSGRLWIVGHKDGAYTISYENSNINLLYDYVRRGKLEEFEIVGDIYANPEMIKRE